MYVLVQVTLSCIPVEHEVDDGNGEMPDHRRCSDAIPDSHDTTVLSGAGPDSWFVCRRCPPKLGKIAIDWLIGRPIDLNGSLRLNSDRLAQSSSAQLLGCRAATTWVVIFCSGNPPLAELGSQLVLLITRSMIPILLSTNLAGCCMLGQSSSGLIFSTT